MRTSTSPPLQRMLQRLSGTCHRLSLNSSFQVCYLSLVDLGVYCDLHIAFLIRALMKSRSGFERSDGLVQYFTRRVIQLGLFAVIWSLAGMATWLLLPKYTIYALFDMTSGSIYTHVSGSLPWNPSLFTRTRFKMLFDTLLSRAKLRERIAERNNFEMWSPSQVRRLVYPDF